MPVSVAIRFTHASLQVLAEDHGIHLLHIKGPAVDDALLEVREANVSTTDGAVQSEAEPPARAAHTVARRSIDADVLVRPAHLDRLLTVMHEHRWTMKYRFEDGSAFEHAATLTHPFLAPVDVHRHFPGIDSDPEAAFTRLWRDRHTVELGGKPCPVPSLTAQRLILILHSTRAGQLAHPDVRRSWTAATEDDRDAVRRLAADLGAEVALAAGTGRLDEFSDARGYALWLALSTGERSLVRMWVARVKAAPNRRAALRTAGRLLVPNPRRLEATLGRAPTGREITGAYWRRARRGGRELCTLLRATFRGARRKP
jgi:Uncharacterised nucleotidyltransferase